MFEVCKRAVESESPDDSDGAGLGRFTCSGREMFSGRFRLVRPFASRIGKLVRYRYDNAIGWPGRAAVTRVSYAVFVTEIVFEIRYADDRSDIGQVLRDT